MIHAGFLYAACVATSAAGVWLSGQLSVQWRSHLTHLLHSRYCTNIASFSLPSSPLSWIDNPDQRITAETATLCDALASAARLAAGAPFRVLYYSYIAWQYLGFRGVSTAFLFFVVFAAVQKIAVLPLARTVVVQEKKEGNLRYLHLRLRERGADVAASRGAAAELSSLDSSLQSALENQKKVVNLKTAVTAATKGTDYSGALLNYALVGAAVFSGAAAAAGAGGSGGELAQFVSNASFASLSLIYSFTEMLDLGEQLSSLAALTARVVGLLEILPPPDIPGDPLFSTFKEKKWGFVASRNINNNINIGMYPTATTNNNKINREMHPSGFATMLCPPTSAVFLNGSVPMELSIHSLGKDLQNEVQSIFPDSVRQSKNTNQQQQQLLCVLTFQFAGGGKIDLSPDRSSPTLNVAAAEMDRLLESYMRWEAALRSAILNTNKKISKRKLNLQHGTRERIENITTSGDYDKEDMLKNEDLEDIWFDSVDPRTGMPLHGSSSSSSNQRWSEVAAARALLHYDRRDAGVCPLVVHPVHGTSAYPVSFFTNAPVEVVLEALSALAAEEGERTPTENTFSGRRSSPPLSTNLRNNVGETSSAEASRSTFSSQFLLSCQNLSFSTPDGRKPLISNLSFSLSPGQWLLISGPNGAGKSTLLRVLSGLHSLTSGNITYSGNQHDIFADPSGAMLLPQRPISAPGPSLWEQIAYPSIIRPLDHVLQSILNDVGLGYLIEQTGGDFEATGPSFSTLSFDGNNNGNEGTITATNINFDNRSNNIPTSFSHQIEEKDELQEKWSSTLSPGEFQRIAIARILLHRPKLALVDEPCSAMDDASAKRLLELVREAGVTCITVAQDTGVYREMHAMHLKLGGTSGQSAIFEDILHNNKDIMIE
jgi:ABC-type uncharacterized transport system fused permease/ATPase subunit